MLLEANSLVSSFKYFICRVFGELAQLEYSVNEGEGHKGLSSNQSMLLCLLDLKGTPYAKQLLCKFITSVAGKGVLGKSELVSYQIHDKSCGNNIID